MNLDQALVLTFCFGIGTVAAMLGLALYRDYVGYIDPWQNNAFWTIAALSVIAIAVMAILLACLAWSRL